MESITEVLGSIIPDLPSPDSGIRVDEISVELPVELHVRQHGLEPVIDASGPRQRIDTSLKPVLHHLRVRIEIDREVLP